MNKIKNIAITGYGSIAKKHLKILLKLTPNSKFFIISKRNIKNNSKKINFLKSRSKLDNTNIDLALICSPSSKHYKDFLYFYKKKSHIFMEKPLSNNLTDAVKIFKNCKTYKKLFKVGYVFRYKSSAKKFKDLLSKRNIGKILDVQIVCDSYLPKWRAGRNYKDTVSANKNLGGGVLLELSHEFDYIQWFFGATKNIFSTFSNNKVLKTNVEEFVNIFLFQKQNYLINARINFNQKFLSNRYCIVSGTKGLLKWNILRDEIKLINENRTKVFKFKDNPFKNQLQSIVNQIEKKKINKTNEIIDSLNILKLIEKIKQSNKKKVLL